MLCYGSGVKKQARRGFTLIEIMLVVAIIAVLLGAGINYLSGSLETAKDTRAQADLQTLATQIKTYQLRNLRYPTTEQGLNALVNPPSADPKPRSWIRLLKPEALMDPWGNSYQYQNPGTHNTGDFDLWSMGADGESGTADDATNWEEED